MASNFDQHVDSPTGCNYTQTKVLFRRFGMSAILGEGQVSPIQSKRSESAFENALIIQRARFLRLIIRPDALYVMRAL